MSWAIGDGTTVSETSPSVAQRQIVEVAIFVRGALVISRDVARDVFGKDASPEVVLAVFDRIVGRDP